MIAILGVLVALSFPREGWTQKAAGVRRIGVLIPGAPPPPDAPRPTLPPPMRAFFDTLAKHGYERGKNLAVEMRVGKYAQLAGLAVELERLKAEVLVVGGTRATRIVGGVVKKTPLVFFSCDPFEHVTRLARPDGNVTGTTCMTTELSPKRLELLKELLPGASRIVFFSDPENAPMGWTLTQEAARRLGVKVQAIGYKGRSGIPDALRAVAKARPDAVLVYPDAILRAERRQLAEFALSHGLPTMNAYPEYADAGGLMSYGANHDETFAMIGRQVAKILDGARPGEVPVQRATQFHLVINLKSAKALGVTVPQSLLIRADRVIE